MSFFDALGNITDLKRQHLSVEEGCLVISTKRPSGQAWLHNAAKVNQYFKENFSSLEAYLEKGSVLFDVEIALFQELEEGAPKRLFQRHIQEKYQVDPELIPSLEKVSIEDIKRLLKLQDWLPVDLFALGQILNNKPDFIHRLKEREPYVNLLKIRAEHLGIDQAEIEAFLQMPNLDNRYIGSVLELLRHITNKGVSLKDLIKFLELQDWLPFDLFALGQILDNKPDFIHRLREREPYVNLLKLRAEYLGIDQAEIEALLQMPNIDNRYIGSLLELVRYITKKGVSLKALLKVLQLYEWSPDDLKNLSVAINTMPDIVDRLKEGELLYNQLIIKAQQLGVDLDIFEDIPLPKSYMDYKTLEEAIQQMPTTLKGFKGFADKNPNISLYEKWLIWGGNAIFLIKKRYPRFFSCTNIEADSSISAKLTQVIIRMNRIELPIENFGVDGSFIESIIEDPDSPKFLEWLIKLYDKSHLAPNDVLAIAHAYYKTKEEGREEFCRLVSKHIETLMTYFRGETLEWVLDVFWDDLMLQMNKMPGFKVHSEMIENIPLLNEILPRIQGLNFKNSPYFFQNIIPFIKNNPDLKIQEAIDLCYGGQAAYNWIEQRYPFLFTNLTLQRKLKLQEEVRKIIQEAKSVRIPLFAEELIIKQLETDSFSINRLIFISILKDIPDAKKSLLLLIEAMARLTPGEKVALLNALVEMGADTRFKTIQKLHYFREENPNIGLLQKVLGEYENLEREGIFEGLSASDRYYIVKLIDQGIPKDALKETLNDKNRFPQYAWVFDILISLGVKSKECVTFLSRFGNLLEGANENRKRVIVFLLKYMNPSFDRFEEALALLNTPNLEKLLSQNQDEKDFVEALFREQILLATLPDIIESKIIEIPHFSFLPSKFEVTKDCPIFQWKTPEEKKVAIKVLIHCLGYNPFPNLSFFTPQLSMEPLDYFLLIYPRYPHEKSQLQLKPLPKFNLRTVLDSIDPTLYTEEVKVNNKRLIDSVLARRDVNGKWMQFKPEVYVEIEKLCRPVYYQMTQPKADRENCRATLKAISDTVQTYCPTDWQNEFIFQHAEWFGSDDPKDLILVLEANARLNVVNVIIEVLSKRLVASGEATSFTGALELLSGNHQRNRILTWLKSRDVPGSKTMNKDIDPHLPDDLNVGHRFHPTEKEVVELFDTLYTLPFLLRELDKAINRKTFLKRDVLTQWLEESRFAEHHKAAEWDMQKVSILKNPPPVIEIKPTDLSAFFEANQTPVDSVDELKSVGAIKQFLKGHKNFPKQPLEAFLKNPTDPSVQKALQTAYNECEKLLKPKMRRDQLRRKLIPCRLEDDEIDDYLDGEITYEELVDAGIDSAQREDFAHSLLDENTGFFKTEAFLVLLTEAHLYF